MKTEIYWVEDDLAILMRPRGGDWLNDEIRDWTREGLGAIVSLLAQPEVSELGLVNEAAACAEAGLKFFRLPIDDLSVPEHLIETIGLIDALFTLRVQGQKIGIHCRQGLGRSPLIAACLLVRSGVEPTAAWQQISQARGTTVPETDEQREWLLKFAEEMNALKSSE